MGRAADEGSVHVTTAWSRNSGGAAPPAAIARPARATAECSRTRRGDSGIRRAISTDPGCVRSSSRSSRAASATFCRFLDSATPANRSVRRSPLVFAGTATVKRSMTPEGCRRRSPPDASVGGAASEDWADRLGFRGPQDVESAGLEWTRIEAVVEKDTLKSPRENGKLVNEAAGLSVVVTGRS